MIFGTHKFSPPWVVDGWCGNCYFTTCGEKVYVKDVTKSSKINRFGDLANAYLLKDTEKIEEDNFKKKSENILGMSFMNHILTCAYASGVDRIRTIILN